MKERTKATVNIMRGDVVVSEVLITASSKYIYKLMGEHYINLDFVLLEPVVFCIGDYIDDELFGRFYITDEVMPVDDTSTCGYKYSIRFDAWYKVWNNKNFMLVTIFDGNGTETKMRKESIWYLTDNLHKQLEHFKENLAILGYKNCTIAVTATTANESHYMAYNGTKMVNALKMLADTWECEYWITLDEVDSRDFSNSKFTIHFGKCEQGEELTFERYKNVEKMTPQRNSDTYANKFYVYGSTDNVPPTYRKICIFTPQLYSAERKLYKDGSTDGINRVLQARMFDMDVPQVNGEISTTEEWVDAWEVHTVTDTHPSLFLDFKWGRTYNILDKKGKGVSMMTIRIPSITLAPLNIMYYVSLQEITASNSENGERDFLAQGAFKEEFAVRLVVKDRNGNVVSTKESHKTAWHYINERRPNTSDLQLTVNYGNITTDIITYEDTEANDYSFHVEVEYSISHYSMEYGRIEEIYCDGRAVDKETVKRDWWNEDEDVYIAPRLYEAYNVGVSFSKSQNRTVPVKIHFLNANGTKTVGYICINPYAEKGAENNGYTFVDANNNIVDVVARKFEIDEAYVMKVPVSYYVSEYDDSSSLVQIGARRLMLPIVTQNEVKGNWVLTPQGYVIRKDLVDNPNADNVVEMVVAFDKIYPDGKMLIHSVKKEERNTITQYDDGSKSSWTWYQYHLQLKLVGASTVFAFKKEYIIEGQSLRIRFLVPSDIQPQATTPCKLAGMQFECGFNPSAAFTEVGGGKYTQSNDFAVVRNEDFGAKLPNETLCPNVGDPVCLVGWDVRAMEGMSLVNNAEQRLKEKAFEYADAIEESQFTIECVMMSDYIRGEEDDYELPPMGAKVNVLHGALKEGSKHSRIIAMELHLDKPYDSPKYTVGETDAYSRLKKLEKEITKISQ